ncbi:hypothetical protein BGZ83_009507 [Gryganskiella cystojenkinii]|nr:hypothetical protein BGZ83_009507 [Gryganskiella cystojenkinii]
MDFFSSSFGNLQEITPVATSAQELSAFDAPRQAGNSYVFSGPLLNENASSSVNPSNVTFLDLMKNQSNSATDVDGYSPTDQIAQFQELVKHATRDNLEAVFSEIIFLFINHYQKFCRDKLTELFDT